MNANAVLRRIWASLRSWRLIVDSLVHVTANGRWFQTDLDASPEALLRQMDEAGVEKAVVTALAGYVTNDFVLSVSNRYAGRLIAGASFDPTISISPEEAVQDFRNQLYEAPFAVLKLHPRLNRYDPLDPRCLAILREAATWARPPAIWIDTLFYYRGAAMRKPVVEAIHSIVSELPALTFALLHAGGSWALQVAEAVRDCPNAFLDLSFTLKRYYGSSLWTDLRYLVKTFDRRLLFGSDFPEAPISEAVRLFGDLTVGIDPEKIANVAGRNLERLLFGRP
jgi:predicted TIM-barrel fold metal-dependent hydrolase